MNDPIYDRVEGRVRPSLSAASVLVIIAAVGLWAASLVAALLRGGNDQLTLSLIYYPLFMLAPMLVYGGRRSGVSESLRLNPLALAPLLFTVTLALLSVFAVSVLEALWAPLMQLLGVPDMGETVVPETTRELVVDIIAMAALPAIFEELLFRGFLLSAWETRGTAFAIGVSAALFALLHGNLYGLPAYLLLGGVAGYLVCASDSLYAGIIYHTVYNAACLILPWLIARGPAAETEPVAVGYMATLVVMTVGTALSMGMVLAAMEMRRRVSARIAFIPRIRRPLSGRERLTLALAILTLLASMALLLAMGGAT